MKNNCLTFLIYDLKKKEEAFYFNDFRIMNSLFFKCQQKFETLFSFFSH